MSAELLAVVWSVLAGLGFGLGVGTAMELVTVAARRLRMVNARGRYLRELRRWERGEL